MSIIYETKGRAREYFELAANLYTGCGHNCVYCYGADVTRSDPREFYKEPKPRMGGDRCLDMLRRDAARLARDYETRHVLLSFVTDPYQPVEDEFLVTRRAIQILHEYKLTVAILTKGGSRARRDFEILTPADVFGTTLTFTDLSQSLKWEPFAAPPLDRIMTLKAAHDLGVQTWVSCEPVIDPKQTHEMIRATADFVDMFKVGTMNYTEKLPRELRDMVRKIDWKKFARDTVELLDSLDASYYIKKDLAKNIGYPDGIREGKLPK